ncbi:hypothetical protein K503DRAFT_222379 [Rhizopogon vinicolor AM-OR11-026]|uniref:Uncharacterized protein n=1 Tax=Rhizopogon vinicolor AM-OR11-026 TaxID=1314800 RepID=A0A1B7NEF2_9AGAM|nr:hypothetical protein K503DRAFT_222379 [Rhizopogon vinicolor AM-OR11-026]
MVRSSPPYYVLVAAFQALTISRALEETIFPSSLARPSSWVHHVVASVASEILKGSIVKVSNPEQSIFSYLSVSDGGSIPSHQIHLLLHVRGFQKSRHVVGAETEYTFSTRATPSISRHASLFGTHFWHIGASWRRK